MNKPVRHPLAWVPTLYLAQGLPFYAVAIVAGLMFKSMGVKEEEVTNAASFVEDLGADSLDT